jgi:outer membrane biosynthesis protein TonB
MLNKRSLVVFAATFAFVLIGGMALAGVGTFSNDVSDVEPADLSAGETTSDVAEESPAPTDKPPAAEREEKPEDKPVEEPKEEPKDKPAAEPKEEPKTEPTDEPKEAADTTPPGIEVLFPEDGAHTKNAVQVFEGVAEPEAVVTRGKFRATRNGEGWRLELVLSPGENRVPFVATDAAGNQSKDWVTVYYDAPKEEPVENEKPTEETPKEEPKHIEVDFTAHQKYGSCGEDIPYDVFHGTARPETKIWIESAHGSATVMANEKGRWEAKVTFKTSEPGVPFTVVIETSDGDRAQFTFVNTGGGGKH